jgi:hypothetical protein
VLLIIAAARIWCWAADVNRHGSCVQSDDESARIRADHRSKYCLTSRRLYNALGPTKS